MMADIALQWRVTLIKEIRRKAIHLSGLSVPFGIVVFGPRFTAAAIAVALIVSLILERQRLNGRIRLPEVRASEESKVAGYIYYILGSLICVLAFPAMIAFNAMLLLSIGDTVSGLVGSIMNKANVREGGERAAIKPIPIVLAMFSACLLIGYFSSHFTLLPFPVYLAGAAAATLADSVAIRIGGRYLNDNFSIPVFSSVVMFLAEKVF